MPSCTIDRWMRPKSPCAQPPSTSSSPATAAARVKRRGCTERFIKLSRTEIGIRPSPRSAGRQDADERLHAKQMIWCPAKARTQTLQHLNSAAEYDSRVSLTLARDDNPIDYRPS